MEQRPSDRRSNTRHAIGWYGECGVGHGYALGMVRDISKRGLFFVPTTELLGMPRWESGEVPLVLRPGDKISLTYEWEPSEREVTVAATVKWVGTSLEHGEFGVGVEIATNGVQHPRTKTLPPRYS